MHITTLAERPEFADAIWELSDQWPPFMLEDPSGDLYYSSIAERWADWTLLAIDDDRLMARGHCITFALGEVIGRPDLPDSGWDGIIHMAYLDSLRKREPTTVGALEILIHPDARGTGLAGDLITAMRDLAAERGFDRVVIPVRPSAKHLEPLTPIDEYAWRTREDGLPHDPWLRTHVRIGGRILKVCPTAMTIPGLWRIGASGRAFPSTRPAHRSWRVPSTLSTSTSTTTTRSTSSPMSGWST